MLTFFGELSVAFVVGLNQISVFFLYTDEFISEQADGSTYRIHNHGSTNNYKGTYTVGTYYKA